MGAGARSGARVQRRLAGAALALAAFWGGSTPAAPLEDLPEPLREDLLLVQSELDFLPAAQTPITLEVEEGKPIRVLREIGRRSGLAIEVRGSLPSRPLLTASFRQVRTREILVWFADQLSVHYRAEPPHKLWVLVDPAK